MRKIYLLTVLSFLLTSQTHAERVKVDVTIKNYKTAAVELIALGKMYRLDTPEDNGSNLFEKSVELDISEPSWARFTIMGSGEWLLLYLTPGNDISVEVDFVKMTGAQIRVGWPTKVFCDDGGINELLLDFQTSISANHLLPFTDEDKTLDGKGKTARFDEIVKGYEQEVKKSKLPKGHKQAVGLFMKYYVALSYLDFIHGNMRSGKPYHQDAAYYNKLASLIIEVPELIGNKIYHEFMKHGIWIDSDREVKTPPEVIYNAAIEKARQLSIEAVKKDLIWSYTTEYIRNHGIGGIEGMRSIVLETFKGDKGRLDYFDNFVNQYSGVAKGQPSPSFNYPDVTGNMVSLEDLRGKYVYIDLWATWCGPCKKEIPYLQKLEHEYVDKNIQFVSISTDNPNSADKWKTMVKEKNMGGIQLHANGDNSFEKAYNVQGIPRFILIDKEGNILDSNALRPSSTGIRELFDALEGI